MKGGMRTTARAGLKMESEIPSCRRGWFAKPAHLVTMEAERYFLVAKGQLPLIKILEFGLKFWPCGLGFRVNTNDMSYRPKLGWGGPKG